MYASSKIMALKKKIVHCYRAVNVSTMVSLNQHEQQSHELEKE